MFDGSDDSAPLNCTQLNHDQWTYNIGIYLHGAANMYNYTAGLPASDPLSADAPLWKARVTGLATSGVPQFLVNGILQEACETRVNCNPDAKSFKAYLSRWMAATTKLAPWTADVLKPIMLNSATAAAAQCSGGVNSIGTGQGRQCGLRWTMNSTYDGDTGVGQQMAALQIIQGHLIDQVRGTFTNKTGGTSQGDPNAGSQQASLGPNGLAPIVVTESDRVGAGFITFFTVLFIIGACYWMVSGERLGSNRKNGSIASDRKREWGWGDLSMGARIMGGRKDFAKKGYADRDSVALEKLGAGGSGMMMAHENERASTLMAPGSERSTMMYASGGLTSDSHTDVYDNGMQPFSPIGAGGSRPDVSGAAMPYSPTSPTAMLGPGGGSRPGSSRGHGV